MKCIVRLCPNDTNDGRFLGPICVPCSEALKGEAKLLSPAWYRVVASALGLEMKVGDTA